MICTKCGFSQLRTIDGKGRVNLGKAAGLSCAEYGAGSLAESVAAPSCGQKCIGVLGLRLSDDADFYRMLSAFVQTAVVYGISDAKREE